MAHTPKPTRQYWKRTKTRNWLKTRTIKFGTMPNGDRIRIDHTGIPWDRCMVIGSSEVVWDK